MLRCDRAGFDHGDRPVLREVTLGVAPGELVAVVGPNGAGKTTLARLLAGLLRPARGAVRVGALDPARAPRREVARALAYVPQRYALAFPFSVEEVVLMGRHAHQRGLGLAGADDLAAAADALRRCDLEALAHRPFDALSGGEQRRALVAQAFAQRAPALVLDEPTAALDPAHARAVLAALRAACDERAAAVLVVTHDLQLAARWADRAVVLADGAVVADGPPLQVLASPAAAAAFGLPLHVGALADGLAYVVPA